MKETGNQDIDGIALASSLSRLSGEMQALHDQVLDLEETIGQVIPSWDDMSSDAASCIQQLDLVRQTLGELSVYLDGLKSEVPQDIRIANGKLLDKIKLRDLAARLRHPRTVTEPRDMSRERDIELF